MGTRAPLFSTFSLLEPLHYPWVLSVVFKCFANIRITFQIAFLCVHAPRGHIYLRFLCAIPVFVAEHGLGSWRYPSLCFGSRSPGYNTSFELPFIAWVAFRLDFMAGIILHFIHSECRFELFHCVRRFQLLWHVSPSRRESLSLVSWCLLYFAVHCVFIVCVAYKFVFSWRVSPSGCFYGVCRLQVVFTACVAFRLAVSGVCRFH